MLLSIASEIRNIVASMIEVDNTPSVPEDTEKEKITKEKKIISIKERRTEDRFIPTALPKIRAPRRQPNFKKKWNTDSKRELMREYMKNYRAEGRDVETGNRYVKKIKINKGE